MGKEEKKKKKKDKKKKKKKKKRKQSSSDSDASYQPSSSGSSSDSSDSAARKKKRKKKLRSARNAKARKAQTDKKELDQKAAKVSVDVQEQAARRSVPAGASHETLMSMELEKKFVCLGSFRYDNTCEPPDRRLWRAAHVQRVKNILEEVRRNPAHIKGVIVLELAILLRGITRATFDCDAEPAQYRMATREETFQIIKQASAKPNSHLCLGQLEVVGFRIGGNTMVTAIEEYKLEHPGAVIAPLKAQVYAELTADESLLLAQHHNQLSNLVVNNTTFDKMSAVRKNAIAQYESALKSQTVSVGPSEDRLFAWANQQTQDWRKDLLRPFCSIGPIEVVEGKVDKAQAKKNKNKFFSHYVTLAACLCSEPQWRYVRRINEKFSGGDHTTGKSKKKRKKKSNKPTGVVDVWTKVAIDSIFKGLTEADRMHFLASIYSGRLAMNRISKVIAEHKFLLSFSSKLFKELDIDGIDEFTKAYGPECDFTYVRTILAPMVVKRDWKRKTSPIPQLVWKALRARQASFQLQVKLKQRERSARNTASVTTLPSVINFSIPFEYVEQRRRNSKQDKIQHVFKNQDLTIIQHFSSLMDVTKPFTEESMGWLKGVFPDEEKAMAILEGGLVEISLFVWNYPWARFPDVVWDQAQPTDDQLRQYFVNCAGKIVDVGNRIPSACLSLADDDFAPSAVQEEVLHDDPPSTA
jgi:hypothetical protein